MNEDSGNLQNDFFNNMRKERAVVTVFLANGKRLVGRIKSFDKFTILLEGQGGDQMVFKHAISTVSGSPRAGSGGQSAGAAHREEHSHAESSSSTRR